jgi:hypothetical protein
LRQVAEGKTSTRKRASYLTVSEQFNLNHACRLLTAAFGFRTYQVGSSLERPDYRDVDLRCILEDAEYTALIGTNLTRLRLLNVALSEWLAARTGLNIDFQFQHQTGANAEHHDVRNFVGIPLDRRGPAEEHDP